VEFAYSRLTSDSNATALSLVPPEELCVVKLEDGLGWEQICPFLGHKIPAEPYPRGNDPNEFGKLVEGFMMRNWVKAFTAYAAVLLPVIGLWAWSVTRRK
jgi:hypothetical protein